MRDGAPDHVLSGSCGWEARISSWLGGTWLGDVPKILDGRIVAAVGQKVPERLTFTVARHDVKDGRPFDWRPADDPRHPLARYGQELQVSVVVTSSSGRREWETRSGRFLITGWDDADNGLIEVTAVGRLRRVEESKLTRPTQPGAGATLMSEARRLLPPGVGASFDPGLVDRACPAGMSWDEDRLAALQEIADAWPALLRTDEWGQVVFRRPLPAVPTPVLTIRDGERGTLVSAGGSDTRDGAFNQVVARTSAAGVVDVQAVAEQTSGPMAVGGDYGPVTRVWSSPLITTPAQAQASAATMLRNSLLPASSIPVECVPDPRIDLDDPVEIIRDGVRTWGWVTGYDLPLTHESSMRVDVGVSR